MHRRRWLLLLTLAVASVRAPDPARAGDDRRTLAAELRTAYGAGDWAAAIELARRIVAIDPGDPRGWYDLACMQSRAGQREGAVESLRTSAERGFDRVATYLRDEDLDAIRKEPGFEPAAALIVANHARSLATFRLKAEREARIRILDGGRGRSREARPLLVALHGRGGDGASFAAALAPVARSLDAILVVPQGMERLAGGGFGWGRVEEGELLVLLAIERARQAHAIDPTRIVVLGFSQGGATAIATGLRHPDTVSGVVVLASGDDPRIYTVPRLGQGRVPRFALGVGEQDPELPETRQLARRLEAEGVRVWFQVEPGLGHELPRDGGLLLGRAIDFALGKPPSGSETGK